MATALWTFPAALAYSTPRPPGRLLLVRHGESEWNAHNRFTGWADVPLTETGVLEAARTARIIDAEFDARIDVAYTSVLQRAVHTAQILLSSLEEFGRPIVPLHQRWRLNERHYGSLTGLSKRDSGFDQFELFKYRMTLTGRPPPMEMDHPYYTRAETKYAENALRAVDPDPLPLENVPLTESLADTCDRVDPIWRNELLPSLMEGNNVLLVGHANQLRALIKCVQNIEDERLLVTLGVPNTMPLVYSFTADGRPFCESADGCFVSPLTGHYLGGECREFNDIDTDGSGTVDASEFKAAGMCDTPKDCDELVDEVDNNGDQEVDFKEFMAWPGRRRRDRSRNGK